MKKKDNYLAYKWHKYKKVRGVKKKERIRQERVQQRQNRLVGEAESISPKVNLKEQNFDTSHPPQPSKKTIERSKKQKPSKERDGPVLVTTPFNVKNVVHVNSELEWDVKANGVFKMIRKLGEGAFGSVSLVEHVSGVRFAVKELRVEEATMKDIRNEVEVLKKCNHTHIVSYFGSVQRGEDTIWILMDYCNMGAIRDVMVTKKKPYSVVILFRFHI